MSKFIIGEYDLNETKSKRLNLLIQPSLYSDCSKIAEMERMSLNEYICRLMESDRTKKLETLIEWHRVFGDKLEKGQ